MVVDPDRGSSVKRPEAPAGRCPWDEVCGAVLAGMDLPDRKRRALIADAGQSRGRDRAEVAVSAPAGGKEAVTVEVRDLAPASQADLAPDESVDFDAVEARILVRAEVKGCILVAARHLALVKEADLVEVWARVLVRAEVKGCILAAAQNLASAVDVDLAPAPDRVEGRILVKAGSQVKMEWVEVRDLVAVRVRALAVDMDSVPALDRVSVRDLDPVKGRVAGSISTDVRMSTCLLRSNRNRKFQ